jgi:MFS family permease
MSMALDIDVSRYRSILSVPAFRLFWSTFTLSALGDSVTRFALTWYVWETTHSAQALGLLAFLYTAPVLAGGLLAGWLLDRYGSSRVMALDNLVRGIAVAAIPSLHLLGALQVWHIYVVVAIYGFLMMISLAGGPALIPDLVSKQQLATANAMETLVYTVSGVLGPPAAGLLIGRLGAPTLVAFDALSYFLFAAALLRISRSVRSKPVETAETSRGLLEGVRLLRSNPVLLSTTVMYMSANLGLGMAFVWLPVYADETLGGGPALFGILLGLMAVGELVSSLAAGALSLGLTLGALITLFQFLSGLSLVLVAAVQQTWAAGLGLGLLGLFSAPLTIWAQTLRMDIIPPELRGRTFALLRMLMQSANPLGGLLAGPLLPLVGIRAAIALSAGFVGLPGLAGSQVRELRTHRVETT